MEKLRGKSILITGAGRRIGRSLALAAAKIGANVIIHHSHSDEEAADLVMLINQLGAEAKTIKADFSQPENAVRLLEKAMMDEKDLFALVNNAAIFKSVKFSDTSLDEWRLHMDINLTTPFLLSQAFAKSISGRKGRIINILDWRALRPGKDHFPYTISKAGLAALTKSSAIALAPHITVNGIALGAILPPSNEDGNEDSIIGPVPLNRWAELEEIEKLFIFLLTGPEYITGEIIHLDGGRHLV